MDTEILQQLELIRVYVLITMLAIVILAIFKIPGSLQNIIIGFKKAWDTAFNNRIEKYLDKGEYKKAIKECAEVLENYPFHADATWFIARAYYGENNYNKSTEYFKKAVNIVPSWKDTADEHIDILRQQLSIRHDK